MCFFKTAENAYLDPTRSLHLETPKLQEVFLSKLTQFSQEKNELDDPASNNDGFLGEISVFHHLT
jgi:hypothetical protein